MSRAWKVGDVYRYNDAFEGYLFGIVGDISLREIEDHPAPDAVVCIGNLATSDPQYLTDLLKLEGE